MTEPDYIQKSLDGKSDVRLVASPRHATPVQLTSRDLALITAIYEAGGVMTTIQLAVLFWPPDLVRRLAHLGLSQDESTALLSKYKEGAIHQQVELWKWLNRISRMHTDGVRKADLKFAEYLEQVKQTDPAGFHQIEALCSQAAAIPSSTWLKQSLSGRQRLPEAFMNRPQLPSEFVSSACKSRLKALANFGVIEPVEQPTRLSEGRAQSCWFLTRRGRKLLADLRRVRPTELDWKPAGAYGTLHLGHRLLINEVRIAVQLACMHRGYTLRQWIDDNQLKRMLGTEKVRLVRMTRDPQTGERREVAEDHALKIPDGYFVLDMGEAGERHCFVELDNQTLTISDSRDSAKDYAQKIRTMSAFYRSGSYKDTFPEANGSMWYLTVTTGSELRMQHLRQTAEKVIGLHNKAVDRYWFTTMSKIPTWEDYFAAAVFTPIWQRAGQERLWALDESYEKAE